MPTYDLDEEGTLFEPLKIKIGGKELTIEDVNRKEFERITDIIDPCEQLAAWAKVPLKEIEALPIRKVAGSLTIIGKELLGPPAKALVPKKV